MRTDTTGAGSEESGKSCAAGAPHDGGQDRIGGCNMAKGPREAEPKAAESPIDRALEWYAAHRHVYEGLTKAVCSTLETLVKDKNIDFLSVSGRTKSAESLRGKILRKEYTEAAEQIHDFSGVRVTAYTESDVRRISEVVRESFHVHPDKSLDKASELGVDRMGYRSFHFVCDLGDRRTSLPEYALFKGLLFEVQIRTVLQHAWAEIEHDRNYKLSGVLPNGLQRRLFVAAGTLELVDRELDAIARAIDEYRQDVGRRADKGELQIGINTTSLTEYLRRRFPSLEDLSIEEKVISELHDFGIETLADLEVAITKEVESEVARRHPEGRPATGRGLVRDAMMYSDIERYFLASWKGHWNYIDSSTVDFLARKYGKAKIATLLRAHKIKRVRE